MSIGLRVGLRLTSRGATASVQKSRPSGTTFDVFADSTRPDDSGNGLTLPTAKKTLSAAMALVTSGKKLGLARGSQWREQITPMVDMSIGVVGSGAMPIINAADIATGWTPASGLTNVWELTWVRPGPITGNDDLGLWVDGVRPRIAVSNIDLRDGAPGGWFVDGGNYRLLTSVVRIQSATDPNSNGKVYEITRRNHAIGWHEQVTASTATVNIVGPIEGKYASNHYNVLASGLGTTENMFLRDGHIHHMVTMGSLTRNVLAAEIRTNLSIAGIPFTAYRAVGTSFSHTFDRCLALFPGGSSRIPDSTAFYAHASTGDSTIASLTLSGCIARGMDGVACASQIENVTNSLFVDPYAYGIDLNGFTTTITRSRVHNTTVSPNIGGALGFRNSNLSGNHTISHCTVYNVTGVGMTDGTGTGSTTISNTAFVTRNAAGTLGSNAFDGGDGAHNYNIYDGEGRAMSGVLTGYTGNHNVFFSFSGNTSEPWIHYNGTLYSFNSLAGFQTASSSNANSVYTKYNEQNSGNPFAFWLGVANGTGGPEVGDFRINPNCRVYDSAHNLRVGTFTDGVPVTLAGPQSHYNHNTGATVATPATSTPLLPTTITQMRDLVNNPGSWTY